MKESLKNLGMALVTVVMTVFLASMAVHAADQEYCYRLGEDGIHQEFIRYMDQDIADDDYIKSITKAFGEEVVSGWVFEYFGFISQEDYNLMAEHDYDWASFEQTCLWYNKEPTQFMWELFSKECIGRD